MNQYIYCGVKVSNLLDTDAYKSSNCAHKTEKTPHLS
jgi:hypothetical protein